MQQVLGLYHAHVLQGFPKEQKSFARVSGYVEQSDIHSPQTTVREALQYSASLRLGPEVSRERREAFVDEVSPLPTRSVTAAKARTSTRCGGLQGCITALSSGRLID